MDSRAKLLGHAIHPILIVFPLGLLGAAVIFDIVHMIQGTAVFAVVTYWMLVGGLISGLLAAVFGLIDWTAIPANTRAKSVGVAHAASNVGALLLFAISWYLRNDVPENPSTAASIFSFGGLLFALVGGWFGGELVERLGIGVHPGANPDAPSSLSTSTAAFQRGTTGTVTGTRR
jgi:uncharacterized membrane protein